MFVPSMGSVPAGSILNLGFKPHQHFFSEGISMNLYPRYCTGYMKKLEQRNQ